MSQTPQTPLMKQWREMKKKHPDAILLFRVGDFYECFNEDAVTASDILGITLTKRKVSSGTTELAGFPHHALDTYLPKLVRAGRRVAICEQLEDPKPTKNLMKDNSRVDLRTVSTKLPNGLTIGPKVELKYSDFNNTDGRFMIHDEQVGVFLSEPNNRWYFAPLILSQPDENRYRLYTELSWKYSEWIWVDEYEEERLPTYYEELVILYQRFVEKYGPLHAPENEAFIKLDTYGNNIDVMEKKVIDEKGKVKYIPGKGFEEIEEHLPKRLSKEASGAIIFILTAFCQILNKLYTFECIRRKTQELRSLAALIGISPKKAFEECSIVPTPSLFD